MRRTTLVALTLALALGGCTPSADRQPSGDPGRGETSPVEINADARKAIDKLLELMRQRLLVQHEVAAYKWHARLAITDPKREQELLEKVGSQADALGLDAGFVRAFFRAQVQAGKLVQQADFDTWGKAGATPPATGEDLKTLRLRIDGLNRQLLDALKDARPWLNEADWKFLQARADVALQGDGITGEVRQLAWAPLLRR